jgi:ketosteroid isomerase-like protein
MSMTKQGQTERAAVLKTIETMNSAFGRGDIDTVMTTYEPGAVVVGQPDTLTSGDAQLRAMFAGFVAARAKFVLGEHDVVQAGDLALHITDWQMTGEAHDGTAMAGRGLSVAVLRRQPDGSWAMVIDNPYGDALLQR